MRRDPIPEIDRAMGRLKSIYSPEYRRFLERLRKARRDAGLTQVQAAGALGRRQPYLSKCETGERRVDVQELRQLAKLYGKPVAVFLPDEEELP